MHTAVVRIEGASSLSQGRPVMTERGERETADDHENRTWRERMHVTPDGYVLIPPMAFKNCTDEAAKRLAIPIKGRGKATYTKVFEAGSMVVEPLILQIKCEDVPGERLFLPIPGQMGKRVWKWFPLITEWGGDVTWHLLDDLITRDIFERVINAAGAMVGIGRFRPANRGYYGRFKAEILSWEESDL